MDEKLSVSVHLPVRPLLPMVVSQGNWNEVYLAQPSSVCFKPNATWLFSGLDREGIWCPPIWMAMLLMSTEAFSVFVRSIVLMPTRSFCQLMLVTVYNATRRSSVIQFIEFLDMLEQKFTQNHNQNWPIYIYISTSFSFQNRVLLYQSVIFTVFYVSYSRF